MDSVPFLARVKAYHEGGWRLALINATAVIPVAAPAHGHTAAAGSAEPAASESPAEPAPAGEVFEISWAFARGTEFETIRHTLAAGEQIPSVSEFFGAAFLYENEIRELFGIDVAGVNVDLKGQLYKTAQRVPFSHAAIKARLEANATAAAKPAKPGARTAER